MAQLFTFVVLYLFVCLAYIGSLWILLFSSGSQGCDCLGEGKRGRQGSDYLDKGKGCKGAGELGDPALHGCVRVQCSHAVSLRSVIYAFPPLEGLNTWNPKCDEKLGHPSSAYCGGN